MLVLASIWRKTNDWITRRETHHKNILDFFKNKPNKLLLINIEQNGWENAVIKYLQKFNNINNNINISNIKIHHNKRDDSTIDNNIIQLINDNVTTCLTNRDYSENEILFQGFTKLDYKFNMFLDRWTFKTAHSSTMSVSFNWFISNSCHYIYYGTP